MEEVAQITRRIVDNDSERLNMLPKHFGARATMHVEGMIFGVAGKMSDDYNGGYWNYYELSNGGFYMAPELNLENLQVAWVENYYHGEMSPDAFGITVCLMTYSNLCGYPRIPEKSVELLSDAFHQLREYALDHPEAAAIFGAID